MPRCPLIHAPGVPGADGGPGRPAGRGRRQADMGGPGAPGVRVARPPHEGGVLSQHVARARSSQPCARTGREASQRVRASPRLPWGSILRIGALRALVVPFLILAFAPPASGAEEERARATAAVQVTSNPAQVRGHSSPQLLVTLGRWRGCASCRYWTRTDPALDSTAAGNGPSARSPPHPALASTMTPFGPVARAMSKHFASWGTAGSASSTAASAMAPPTTNSPPGTTGSIPHQSKNFDLPLDRSSRGMSVSLGSFRCGPSAAKSDPRQVGITIGGF